MFYFLDSDIGRDRTSESGGILFLYRGEEAKSEKAWNIPGKKLIGDFWIKTIGYFWIST